MRRPSAMLEQARVGLRAREAFMWLIPVFVAVAAYSLSEKKELEVIGACVALLLFAVMLHRPGGTLIALVIFLPLEVPVFGFLYGLHVPGEFLRQASSIKELMVLTIFVAGLREIRDTGKRLDRIDIALLLYIGVVTIYLIAPHVFSAVAPNQISARLLAYRADIGYVLVFFGLRHAPIGAKIRERFNVTIMCTGSLIAAVGIYQKIDPQGYQTFALNHLHVLSYQVNVLNIPLYTAYANLLQLYTIAPLRVGSLLFSSFDTGDYLVVVTAICAVRITRNYKNPWNYPVLALAMATLFFTEVRADQVAALVLLIFIGLPTAKSPVEGRLRIGAVLLVGAVVIVPVLAHSSRFFNNKVAARSSEGHIYEIDDGIGVIYYYPLGLGLGQQPGTANRIAGLAKLINNGDVSDNMITQVGDELGLQALIPWLAMMGFILIGLKRRASTGDLMAAGGGFALLGIVIAGQFHEVFLEFPVPWTVWAAAGLGLSTYESGPFPHNELEAIPYPSAAGVR
jgi:hypothetical protein